MICVSINGLGDLDLLTLKLVHEVENIPSKFGHAIGLWVLELFAVYATDEQTDGQTKATLIAPFPTGGA